MKLQVPTLGNYTVALFEQHNALQSDVFAELISQGNQSGPGFYIGKANSGNVRISDLWVFTGIPFPEVGSTHHIALSVDSLSNTSSLYIDGALASILDVAITTTTDGTDTRLGAQFDHFTEYFTGSIEDLRIYDTALNAAEIRQISGVTPVPVPTAMLLMGTGLAGLLAIRRKRGQYRMALT